METITDIVYSLSPLDWALAGALVVLFIYQLYFYIRYIAAVSRQNRKLKKHPLPDPASWPGVSVVVSARNEEVNLGNYLHALLEQDYPTYEVIVVNDGSEDRTAMVLEEYRVKYRNLHVTFVPVEARVTSSKKLALTLAVKAAQYENLLFTDADCVPESNQWIREMVKGLQASAQTQIVLGYSPYFPMKNGMNRIVRYETLFNGLHYMGRALAGHPYMGVGRNMLYTKSLFMEQKGFAGLLTLRAGDDDLFINKASTHSNTTVVCNAQAVLYSLPKTTFREWIMQKRRHLAASSFYKASSRMMLGVESMMRGMWYLTLIACCIWGNVWVQALAGVLFVVRWLVQLGVINRSARQLGERKFGLEIIWYDICLPLLTALLLSTQPKNQINRW